MGGCGWVNPGVFPSLPARLFSSLLSFDYIHTCVFCGLHVSVRLRVGDVEDVRMAKSPAAAAVCALGAMRAHTLTHTLVFVARPEGLAFFGCSGGQGKTW